MKRKGRKERVSQKAIPTARLAQSGEQARLLVKQALVLPALGQAVEAETCARQACWVGVADDELRIAAGAALAWLLWRRHSPELAEWIAACKSEIRNQRSVISKSSDREPRAALKTWLSGLSALLADFAGEWAEAQRAYLELGRPPGMALAACRQGDCHLEQGDIAGAQELYGQASEIWEAEDDAWGLALARYRQAEAHWRAAETDRAAAKLRAALELLELGEAAQEDRQAVQLALAALEAGAHTPRPAWPWQRYDDTFRISILFRP
ncbi:MAG: hypothetical protein JW850_18980 [Thermoflexales bacterium]|nr:hypothetical protein [Thermoflexales bacterium]